MEQFDEENETRRSVRQENESTETQENYSVNDTTEPHVITRSKKLFSGTGKWLISIVRKGFILIIFSFLLLFFIKIAAPNFLAHLFMPTAFQITSSSVMDLLKSEPVKKLILNESTIRVAGNLKDLAVKSGDDSVMSGVRDFILGEKQLFFMINVKYSYGIDLEKITSDSVRVDGQTITVILPEPEVLENKPDYNTLDRISKTPVLRAIWDNVSGRDITLELVTAIQNDAGKFAQQNGMNLSKEECIKYLEAFFNAIILGRTDKQIIFK
jgi:hypothetical protein